MTVHETEPCGEAGCGCSQVLLWTPRVLERLREHADTHRYSHTLDDCALYQAALAGAADG